MSLLRIPDNRVIDVVPIAFMLIALSVPWIIPSAVPAVMLHTWLWLRYPRSRSRYIVFAAVMTLVLGLFVAFPILANYLLEKSAGAKLYGVYSTDRITGILMSYAAAGILPLIYRLLSRCSLTNSRDQITVHVDHSVIANEEETRAGISDLLWLTLLSAAVCFVLRIPKAQFYWDRAPAWDLFFTIVFSIVALIAMRLNANFRRGFSFAAFSIVWIGGFFLFKVSVSGLHSFAQDWLGDPRWLEMSRYRIPDSRSVGTAMMLLAFFPIVCGHCGIALTQKKSREKEGTEKNDRQDAITSSTKQPTTVQYLASQSLSATGHIALLLLIAAITIYPFTWTSRYDDSGYRVAGWPLTYLTANQVIESKAPWYWVESSAWEMTDFRVLPLIADLFFTATVWMLILPVRSIVERLTKRRIDYGRVCLACLFAGLLAYTVFGEPYFKTRSLSSIENVTVDALDDNPKLGLFARIAHDVDTELRGSTNRIQRGGPKAVTVMTASSPTLDHAIACRSLQSLRIQDSEISPSHFNQILHHPHLRSLQLEDCRIPLGAVERLVSQRRLKLIELTIDGKQTSYQLPDEPSRNVGNPRPLYELQFHTDGGEITLSKHVQSLRLVVPDHRNSRVTLTKAESLGTLIVQNSVDEITDSVCELVISDAPDLTAIKLDNFQRFNLSVEHAPRLQMIHGFFNRYKYCPARLTALKINRAPKLNKLAVDLSDCRNFEIAQTDQVRVMHSISLSGHSGLQQESGLPSISISKRLANQIPVQLSADFVTLSGFKMDANLVARIPISTQLLHLYNCQFTANTHTQLLQRVRETSLLIAADLAPNDQQLSQLLQSAINLRGLQVNAGNLKSIPSRLVEQFSFVGLDDIAMDENELLGLEWRNANAMTLRNSKLTSEILLSWHIPKLHTLKLVNSPISPETLAAMKSKWPLLNVKILRPGDE